MAWGSTPSYNTGYLEVVGGTGTQNFTVSMVAGDAGFVSFEMYDNGTDPNGANFKVYDNIGGSGAPWSVIWGQANVGPQRAFIAYKPNLPSGITTISVVPHNGGAGGGYWGGAIFCFAGGHLTSLLDTNNDGGPAGTPPWTISSLTPSSSGMLIIATVLDFASSGGTTWTTPSGFTDIANTANYDTDNPVEVCYQIASGTGPFSPTFTPNGQVGAAGACGVIASFAPAGGGGGPSLILLGQACL